MKEYGVRAAAGQVELLAGSAVGVLAADKAAAVAPVAKKASAGDECRL